MRRKPIPRRKLLQGIAGGCILQAGLVAITAADHSGQSTGSLERVRPAEDSLTVQPDTPIMFEVGGDDADGIPMPEWYLDGEMAGLSMGPWESAYFDHQDAVMWIHTFESDREVAAAPSQAGYDGVTTTWNIDLASDGVSAPSITAVEPSTDERLSRAPGETIDLGVAASDPDGALDRVVWWGHAIDVVLEVTSIEGDEDTATLSIDAEEVVPEGVRAWVIDEHGAIAETDGWEFDHLMGFDVTDLETNSPIGAGETLEVDATIQNVGHQSGSTDVDLIVGHDPEREDREHVELEPDESTEITLTFQAGEPAGDTEEFPVVVDTGTDTVSEMVVVEAATPATFEVAEMATNSPVGAGETLEVDTTIYNVGDETGTTDIDLIVGHDPVLEDSETLTLDPGESEELVLTFQAGEPAGDTEEFPVVVDTGADSDSATVVVEAATPATFEVASISTNSPIGGGEILEVDTTIHNVGDETGTTDIELIVGHDPAVEDSEMLTLEPDETADLTLTFQAGQPAGDTEEFPVEVNTGADSDSTMVIVRSLEDNAADSSENEDADPPNDEDTHSSANDDDDAELPDDGDAELSEDDATPPADDESPGDDGNGEPPEADDTDPPDDDDADPPEDDGNGEPSEADDTVPPDDGDADPPEADDADPPEDNANGTPPEDSDTQSAADAALRF